MAWMALIYSTASRVSLCGRSDAPRSAAADGLCRYRTTTDTAFDETDGDRGDLPKRKHQSAASRAPGASVSASEHDHRPTESGVDDGHHVPADAPRVFVSGCGDGLVQPKDPRLEALEHDACGVLCECFAGSHRSIRRPRDHEYRPGRSIYEPMNAHRKREPI